MIKRQPNNLMVELYTRILDGEILSELDLEKSSAFLIEMAIANKVSNEEFKKNVKKFRKAIPNFLSKFEKQLSELESSSDRLYKFVENEQKRVASLPPNANSFDAPELVDFIRSLNKEYYSFSEAERLMGVSRQTLADHSKKEQHGLNRHPVGKREKLHKAEMIDYMRATKFKNWNPITQTYDV